MAFWLAIGFLTLLCISLAAVLAVANRRLRVEEDPRIERVEEMLPGANCGACGLPGCRAFAEHVVGGSILPGQCPVGGPETATAVASYLGIESGAVERQVARLLCAGGDGVALQIGEYSGYSSCRAAATIGGGFKGCTFGCLGLADCEVACTFDVIRMAGNGLPVVDAALCTGCGDCVEACPKGLFELMGVSRHLVVQCRTILEGEPATALCKVACNGCSICVADSPDGLLEMQHNLPVVNLQKLELQSPVATYRCPTGAIQWIDGQQFPALRASVRFSNDRVSDRVVETQS